MLKTNPELTPVEMKEEWPIYAKRLIEVSVDGGKYRFTTHEGRHEIFVERHGEPWLIITKGHNAILALMQQAEITTAMGVMAGETLDGRLSRTQLYQGLSAIKSLAEQGAGGSGDSSPHSGALEPGSRSALETLRNHIDGLLTRREAPGLNPIQIETVTEENISLLSEKGAGAVDLCRIKHDRVTAYFAEVAGALSPNIFWFSRLHVKPAYRRKGIATALMTRLVEILDRDRICVMCEVNPYGDLSREQLIAFYKKFGFRQTSEGWLARHPK